jgi:hypothetical protein
VADQNLRIIAFVRLCFNLMSLLTTLAYKREYGLSLPKPYVDLLNYFDQEKGGKKTPILPLAAVTDRWCSSSNESEFRFSERGLRLALQVLGDVGETLWYPFIEARFFLNLRF